MTRDWRYPISEKNTSVHCRGEATTVDRPSRQLCCKLSRPVTRHQHR